MEAMTWGFAPWSLEVFSGRGRLSSHLRACLSIIFAVITFEMLDNPEEAGCGMWEGACWKRERGQQPREQQDSNHTAPAHTGHHGGGRAAEAADSDRCRGRGRVDMVGASVQSLGLAEPPLQQEIEGAPGRPDKKAVPGWSKAKGFQQKGRPATRM